MSFQELVILMFVALILFGPDDLPDIARAAGKIVYEIKKMFNEVTKEFQEAVDTPKNVLQNAFEETVNGPKSEVGSKEKEEELLTYEDEMEHKEVEQNQEDNNDPLADLPQEMVSYEEKGASR